MWTVVRRDGDSQEAKSCPPLVPQTRVLVVRGGTTKVAGPHEHTGSPIPCAAKMDTTRRSGRRRSRSSRGETDRRNASFETSATAIRYSCVKNYTLLCCPCGSDFASRDLNLGVFQRSLMSVD
jgi:hypothetical protein